MVKSCHAYVESRGVPLDKLPGSTTANATVAKNALTEIRTNVPSLALLPNYADVLTTTNRGNNEMIFSQADTC